MNALSNQRLLAYLTVLSIVFICSGCAQDVNGSVHSLSYDKIDMDEVRAGRDIHKEIVQQIYPYQNVEVNNYVRQIGKKLISYVERDNLPYQFTILYDQRIYATAAPGGFIYITTGMINFVDNESQLAAVLAHELGRVQSKSPQTEETKKFFNTLSQTGQAVGPMFGNYGTLAAVGLQLLGAYMSVDPPAIDKIVLADKLALDYLAQASYDPQGLIDFLYKISQSETDEHTLLYHYLVSHEISVDRMKLLDRYFEQLPIRGQSFNVNRDYFNRITEPVRKLYSTE
ncbi:MAG: M48 family metalloprotease [Candidatus Omnitrophica bacterium]|nr:M48 family metalloprotease [Candidatus Omnitrophota bacterium]